MAKRRAQVTVNIIFFYIQQKEMTVNIDHTEFSIGVIILL